MQATFSAFLSLEQKAQKLGCGPFRFNAETDLITAGNDPAVYRRGHELLRRYLKTHRYAVVALDFAFEHRLSQVELMAEISRNVQSVGWDVARFAVVLIVPELEQWFWQDPPTVQQEILQADLSPNERADQLPLRELLRSETDAAGSLWPEGSAKPRDPKAAVQRAVIALRRRASAPAIFGEVFRRVSVQRCQDPAFMTLRSALQTWFPPAEAGASA